MSEQSPSQRPSSEIISRAWRENCVALAMWCVVNLVNRFDLWGLYKALNRRDKSSSRTMPYEEDRGRKKLDQNTIARHFRLQRPDTTIGFHSTSPNNTCRWGSLDVDCHAKEEATPEILQERWERAKALGAALNDFGLRTIVEDSNGNGGYHIWCLFSEPVPSERVYQLLHYVKKRIGGKDIETFPKQPRVSEDKPGNWIRLFGKHHDGREHWSRFWNGERWLEGDEAIAYLLASAPNDPAVLAAIELPSESRGRAEQQGGDQTSRALKALRRLQPERADNYDAWIAVGQALHAVDSSDTHLLEWEKWSRQSKKFREGECAEKWNGFTADGGRTLAHLETWADQDDPQRASRKRRNDKPDAEKLFDLIEHPERDLWRTPDGRGFATVRRRDNDEHLRIKSKQFRTWLSDTYRRVHGRVANGGALTNAIDALEARALERGQQFEVVVRLGRIADTIYYDLGNAEREIVEITSDGWQITKLAPIRFHRPASLRPVPTPIRGGSIEALRALGTFGKEDDNFVLFVGWSLAALRGRKPYPILDIEGEHGAAKSTHTNLARQCVDPASPPMRSAPDDERALAIAARQTHVLALDNLSRVAAWLSDALCRMSTGSGFGTRQLYTDEDEIVFDQARPVILNGITELATRSDLRDRCFKLNLPAINEETRRTEDEVWDQVNASMPGIMGALFDAVVMALRDYRQTIIPRTPRMADVAKWITAAEPALGWRPGTFLNALARSRASEVLQAVEHDAVASAIHAYAMKQRHWVGTPTSLLELLTLEISTRTQWSPEWPDTVRKFSDRVRRAIPDLRQVGVIVECGRGDARWIEVTASPELATYDPRDDGFSN